MREKKFFHSKLWIISENKNDKDDTNKTANVSISHSKSFTFDIQFCPFPFFPIRVSGEGKKKVTNVRKKNIADDCFIVGKGEKRSKLKI